MGKMLVETLWTAVVLFVIFLISALPLYFAVVLLGGKESWLKTAFISLISGLIVAVIELVFRTWGWLIAFVVLIWIYHEAFRLKWWKAVVVWFLQGVFIVLFYIVLVLLLGSLLGISLVL